MRYSVLTAVVVLIVTGCAGAGSASRAGTGGDDGSDVITYDQLRELQGVSTAFDAVQRVRPQFLRGRIGARGIRGRTPVLVYVNGSRAGGVHQLHRIAIDAVQEIRYVNGRDATTKYGTNHGSGVIEVSIN